MSITRASASPASTWRTSSAALPRSRPRILPPAGRDRRSSEFVVVFQQDDARLYHCSRSISPSGSQRSRDCDRPGRAGAASAAPASMTRNVPGIERASGGGPNTCRDRDEPRAEQPAQHAGARAPGARRWPPPTPRPEMERGDAPSLPPPRPRRRSATPNATRRPVDGQRASLRTRPDRRDSGEDARRDRTDGLCGLLPCFGAACGPGGGKRYVIRPATTITAPPAALGRTRGLDGMPPARGRKPTNEAAGRRP